MVKAKAIKYARRLLFYTLDAFAVLYLLDWLSFYLASEILDFVTSLMLKFNRYFLFRWIVIVYFTYRVGRFAWHRHRIANRLKNKQDEVLDKHGRLNEKLKATQSPKISTEEVSQLSVSQIREKLSSNQITAVDLIDAYQRRVLEIFRCRAGCISEIIFDADVYAILADEKFKNPGDEPIGPLHGIPVGVQEIFPVRGYDHTMGYTSRANRPAQEDCALVAALKSAGAVPFVLTNFRQKILGVTCENPIFGRTKHPTHPHRACISGDAVLLALGGTPLSFAADLLGDARLSAASCGMACFKPTTARMTQKGFDLPIKLPHAISVVPSPISRTTTDIVDALKSLWTNALYSHDSTLCPLPFNDDKYTRAKSGKLRIGYYTGFPDLLSPSTAVDRVMSETKEMLEKQGHQLVAFKPPDYKRAYQLFMSLLTRTLIPETLELVYSDGHGDILSDYKQRFVHALYFLPSMFRKLLVYWRAIGVERHYPIASVALRGMGSNKRFTELEYEADQYAQTFFDAWNESELDCVLCPVSPLPTPWDYSSYTVVNGVFLYTALYNMIGCAAGTVKAGRVERADIDLARDNVKAGCKIRESLLVAQQMDVSEGLPINIQVVAKPWDDELALGLMHTIEQEMKKD